MEEKTNEVKNEKVNFLKELIVNPINIIKDYAQDKDIKLFNVFMTIFIIFMSSVLSVISLMDFATFEWNEFVGSVVGYFYEYLDNIILFTIIIYVLFNKNKKSFKTIFSTITIAHIPYAYIYITSLIFKLTGMKFFYFLSGIISTFTLMITVLLYIAVKELIGEENKCAIIFYWILVISSILISFM